MKVGQTLTLSSRQEWRAWLEKHHQTEKEIWLIYHHKDSGKPRISYNDAVEEALCFGWIDSTIKPVDGERYAQRFSVRNRKSPLSQMNKERVYKLVAQRRMAPAGLEAIAQVFDPEKEKPGDFQFPPEILAAIQANPQAWQNFQKFPDVYKRIRVAYIQNRKEQGQEELYQKSLAYFIKMTARNKRFGFVKEMTGD